LISRVGPPGCSGLGEGDSGIVKAIIANVLDRFN
jgi:hypothetical protein